MGALKYTIGFVKTCDLNLLYLVFENEISLRHLNFLFSNTLFTHSYDAIAFHSYEIYIFMMSIEVPWFCIMIGGVLQLFSCLNVKITTFELEKINFVVYLIVLHPMPKEKTKKEKLSKKTFLCIYLFCKIMKLWSLYVNISCGMHCLCLQVVNFLNRGKAMCDEA
jgi:hypothetical protein